MYPGDSVFDALHRSERASVGWAVMHGGSGTPAAFSHVTAGLKGFRSCCVKAQIAERDSTEPGARLRWDPHGCCRNTGAARLPHPVALTPGVPQQPRPGAVAPIHPLPAIVLPLFICIISFFSV